MGQLFTGLKKKRQFVLLLGLGVSLALFVYAYTVIQRGESLGFVLILDHLFNFGLAVVLLTFCAAVGLFFLQLFRFGFNPPLEALLFGVAIGSGAIGVSILVLGFAVSLRTTTFVAMAVAWALLARKQFAEALRLVSQAVSQFKAQSNRFSRFVLTVMSAFLISQALLPPKDWDSLMYHLRVPVQFLERGGFFVPEDNFHVAFVQLIHMLYLPLLSVGSLASAAVLSALFALLLGLAVFAFSVRFYSATTASFSLVLLWATTMISLVAMTARVDVTLAYFLLLAHFALFLAWTDWRFFYVSAVMLGLAFGVKYHALIYVMALSPLVVYVALSKEQGISLKATMGHLGCFGIIFVCVASPWLLKNWLLLEAPIYPFLTGRQVNSWLDLVYMDQALVDSVNPKVWTMLGEVRARLNLFDLFVNPSRLTVEQEALAYRMNPLFLCVVLWIIAVPRARTLNWLLIPPLIYVIGLFLFSAKTNLRYIIPVIAPLTIAAVHLTIYEVTKILGLKRMMIAMSLISVVVLWPMAHTLSLWTLNRMSLAYWAGLTSQEKYLANNIFPPDYYPASQVVTYVNQHLAPANRVLMLFEARGLYFKVPVIQDNLLTNWPLLSARLDSIGCLESARISHVLVNGGALSFYLGRGLSPEIVQWKQFHEFAQKCLVPVYQGVGHILYEVRKSTNQPSS